MCNLVLVTYNTITNKTKKEGKKRRRKRKRKKWRTKEINRERWWTIKQ
jgi:hypothetical protein